MLKRMSMLLVSIILLFQFPSDPLAGQSEATLLPWEEVRQLFPRYSKFTVVDVETGLAFRVQRRAGSRHADVQPLTTEDTKIMKKIYGGKWSWKRRAIYALHGKKKIAASMNGMPHGAGALQNNFRGHFCIHFYKSSTHSKREMDLSHKLMVYKAAGRLEKLLATDNPYDTVTYFIAGLKEQDKKIVSALSIKRTDWKPLFHHVENVKISKMPELPVENFQEELTISVPIVLEWQINGEGRVVKETEVTLFRASPANAWRIDTHSFIENNPFLSGL
ncbi:hypothetical protein [Bacillus sp. FJAT-27225]|uniref:hypothetical protein n=1 Tax=Bacillus sp. FJAT-27225 TaxID=1743144 RepID=UPI000AC1A4E9|nr:hypothetical protein [Bacillus sp. FJAT-27225]